MFLADQHAHVLAKRWCAGDLFLSNASIKLKYDTSTSRILVFVDLTSVVGSTRTSTMLSVAQSTHDRTFPGFCRGGDVCFRSALAGCLFWWLVAKIEPGRVFSMARSTQHCIVGRRQLHNGIPCGELLWEIGVPDVSYPCIVERVFCIGAIII